MRVNGKWLECEYGVIRPSISGLVRLADKEWVEVSFLLEWVEVSFLLDAGADRTVFNAWFLHLLRSLEVDESERVHLAGIGGHAASITVKTAIGFIKDDGRPIIVRGAFHVFTEGESADLSVLGRDVTNNFSVIYDYPNETVALLAPPHHYEIKRIS